MYFKGIGLRFEVTDGNFGTVKSDVNLHEAAQQLADQLRQTCRAAADCCLRAEVTVEQCQEAGQATFVELNCVTTTAVGQNLPGCMLWKTGIADCRERIASIVQQPGS